MKKTSTIIIALSAVLLLGACGNSAQPTNKQEVASAREFGVSLDAEVSTVDPALSQDTVSNEVINQVMEGLYRLDPSGKPIPAMAEKEADISPDGLTYTFTLKDHVKWSDGSLVTANDFVYAWQRVADPATGSNYANLMYFLKNGEKINLAGGDPNSLGVKALDDTTLEVTLETPTPYFSSLITGTTFFPVKEDFATEQGDDFATNSDTLLYNGPFILTDWDGTSSQWTYQKNQDYWDADNVQLDLITNQVIKEIHTGFNLYQNQELDKINLTGEFAKQNAESPDFVSTLAARSTYIELDHANNPALQNQHLREALALVINSEQVADNIIQDGSKAIHGLVTTQLMENPKTGLDFREDAGAYLTYDVKKATDLWQTAKKELQIDTLELELVMDDDDTTKKVAEALQAEIEDNLTGIKLTLKRVPKKMRVELGDAGKFDLLLSGWGADKLDATAFLDLFTTDSSFNSGSFSNLTYDKLMEQVQTDWNNDPQKRYEGMIAAEKILMEDVGIIPLYQKSNASLISPKVNGLVTYPVGSVNYKYVTIEKE
ncbi:peptide ABC transporter substrate-binding protein [Vagococcus sp. BWB3-3]|uniref:Peptide ABC transporter substrate-binding protein n=1 Tax=Vagococcus allomyrinae TaxID=2794353 RepID=A0A940P1H9_9ENTE|nr:peptide ABC transporter substrate-binding protein [Vagococcus allomyrinae]MBP1039742.1 peptide ABC transporter substrate-binding protein [Vagococcus allomyrinae]